MFSRRKPEKRILFSAVFGGIFFNFIFDFLALINHAWAWDESQFIFPFKITGVVSIDEMLWLFLWTLFILVFYEHFFEREAKGNLSRNAMFAWVSVIGVLVCVLGLYRYTGTAFLRIEYAYASIATATLLPLSYVTWKRPRLLVKFFMATLFLCPLFFAIELAAI